VGEDGRILFMNKAMETLAGRGALGKPCWLSYKDDKRQCAECPLKQPIAIGTTRSIEATGLLGGRTFKISHTGMNYHNRKAVLQLFQDITDKKKLEAERLRAQRLESIGTLASGIAHDINNILVPIGLIAAMLREEVKNPSALRWLDIVETNVQRGATIVKQVLSFSRGHRSDKVPTQTRQLLEEVANVIRETFPKTIQLEIKWPKDLWPVLGDATQLEQVLMNLAINARDAMPAGGALTLAAENLVVDELFASGVPDAKAGPHVAWLVADTGRGIPPIGANLRIAK
jgi:signal transduction histidine kinase